MYDINEVLAFIYQIFFSQRKDIDPPMVLGGQSQRADQFSDMAHSGEHTRQDQSYPFAYRSASPTDLTKCPHCVTPPPPPPRPITDKELLPEPPPRRPNRSCVELQFVL